MASYCRLPCIAWFLKTGTIIWGETRSKQLRRWKESADSADCLLTKYLGVHNVKKSSRLFQALWYIYICIWDCHTHAITLSNTDQQHLVQDPTDTFGIYWILKDCRRAACGARSNWQTTLVHRGAVSPGSHNIRAIVYKWIRKRMYV